MLYVLEGSTLGGRIILRMLASRGVQDPSLAFLDPYGAQTGARWRGFLAVLAREADDNEERIAQACDGARSGFSHAERLLCQGTP
jgi:heme oxygenase